MDGVAARVKNKARELGFTHAGISRAEPLGAESAHLVEWLARGLHASMSWMGRNVERRSDPSAIVPGAKTVICVGLNYFAPFQHPHDPSRGKISRYAWGEDYHRIMGEKLEALQTWIGHEFPGSSSRAYVDTGPVMEKAWAQRSGVGWIGKHTNVITRDRGSWIFLGELITTVTMEPDPPETDHCGTCALCMEACPTQAIVEPYLLDANLCISYLTIEHRGPLDGEVTRHFDGWIFGCDVCQDVCPWNRKFAAETEEQGFSPREGNLEPPLPEWSAMGQEEFSARFQGSPVKRAKHEGLMRNIAVALGHERVPQGPGGLVSEVRRIK